MIPKKSTILLNVKFVVKFPIFGKQKLSFVIGLIIIKVNIERLERIIGKFLRNYFTLTIVSMVIATLQTGNL